MYKNPKKLFSTLKKTFLRFPTLGFRKELLPSIAGDLSFKEAKEKAENILIDLARFNSKYLEIIWISRYLFGFVITGRRGFARISRQKVSHTSPEVALTCRV